MVFQPGFCIIQAETNPGRNHRSGFFL